MLVPGEATPTRGATARRPLVPDRGARTIGKQRDTSVFTHTAARAGAALSAHGPGTLPLMPLGGSRAAPVSRPPVHVCSASPSLCVCVTRQLT
jgi:hypothetical protein